jgi:hypothetical protein
MLEARGLATVVIGLVRPHMARSANPRGLFVPFPLGRPLGEPADPAFQHRVLAAALALLDRPDGPVLLEDFPHDSPSQHHHPAWTPAFTPHLTAPATPAEWQAALDAEIARALPSWTRARNRAGRTAVGVSFQPPMSWGAYARAFLAGHLPPPPQPRTPPPPAPRVQADPQRAFILEAAMADGPVPPPDQLNAWLYSRTMAGRLLIALRTAALASDDSGFKTMGSRFLVPTPWVPTG